MFRSARRVFGLIIVKSHRRHDLDDAERLLTYDRAGQLLTRNVLFDDDPLPISPIRAIELLRRMGMLRRDDEDTDTGAFGDRLDHIRRRHDVLAPDLEAGSNHPLRYR